MPGSHGKSAIFLKDQYNLGVQSTAINLAWSCPVEEDTCFGDSATTFQAGIEGWTIAVTSNWRDTAGSGTDIVYEAALGASGLYSFYPRGATVGYAGYGTEKAVQATYNIPAAPNAIVKAEVNHQGCGTLDRLRCLGASTSTSTGASAALASYNYGASTASMDLAGYLHVTAIAGANPSVAFVTQESTDDNTWADLFSFTAVTAVGAERKTATGSCAQYARLKYTPNASTTSVTFYAGLHRE